MEKKRDLNFQILWEIIKSMNTLDPRRYSRVIDLGDDYYFVGISERMYRCKGNYVEYPIGFIVKLE